MPFIPRSFDLAGSAQPVFLGLFSYALFFEGYTGLTVTVGAVIQKAPPILPRG